MPEIVQGIAFVNGIKQLKTALRSRRQQLSGIAPANLSDSDSKGGDIDASANTAKRDVSVEPKRISGLAGRTEAMFSTHSSLGLPAVVFAAAKEFREEGHWAAPFSVARTGD